MNGNLKRVMAAFLSFAMVASTPIQYVQAADEETATKAAESEAAVSEASEDKEDSLPTLDDAIKSENPIDIYKDTGDKFLKGLTDEESYKYMILVRYNLTEKIQKDRQSLNEDIEKYVDISKNWTDRKPECRTEEETKQLDEQLAKWEDEISVSLGEKEYIKDEKTVKTSDSKSYHEYLAAITKIDAEKCLKLLSDITDAQNDEELTKAKEAFVDFNESVYGFDEEAEEETKSDEKTTNSAVPSVANVAGTTLEYEAHVANKGWMGSVSEGQTAGTTGQNLQLEAFTIAVKGNSNLNISYSAFQQDSGWQNAKTSTQIAGEIGKNKRIEAIKMHLTGTDADKYDIYYRVHASNFGWMGWAKNGEVSGSVGYKYAVQAFQITIVQKGSSAPGTTTHHFDTQAVARVGRLYYGDYESAFNAVNDGGTVYLVRSASLKYGTVISKNVTITPDVGSGENGAVTLSKVASCKTETSVIQNAYFFKIGPYTGAGSTITRNTVIFKGNINFDGANTPSGSGTGLLECSYETTLKIEPGVNIYNSHQYGINSIGKLIINGANIHDNDLAGIGCWGNLRIYNSNIYGNNKSLSKLVSGTAGGIHVNLYDTNKYDAGKPGRKEVESEYIVEIENCNIYKNRNGLNIFAKDPTKQHPIKCTIKNSSIHDNWVDGILTTYGGGAYFAQEVTANIENTTFSNNDAINNMGGGIYNLGNLTIRNSSINGSSIKANKAQGSQGGGIYNKGTLTLENTALSDNIADYGSAVYQNGTFNASGSKTGTGNNDVYLPKDKYVTVTGALSNKIVVTPNEYKNGRVVAKITHDSKIGSLDYNKFTLTPNGNYVLRPGDAVTNVANDTIIVSTPYTISYDANGGSGAPSSTTKYWNEASALSNTIPVRPGYAFTYWTTNADGSGTRYNAGANIPYDANANLKLYAQWTANQYTNTLSYNANGGSGAPASQTANVTFPNTQSTFNVSSTKPTRTGYTFAGWYDAASGGNKIGSTVTVGSSSNAGNQSRTIYAHWTRNAYSITTTYYYYYQNSQWKHFDTRTDTRYYGESFSPYNISAPTGYHAGNNYGYYDASGKLLGDGTVGTNSFTVTQDVNVHVHYYPNTYYVTYDANGGTGAPDKQAFIYDSNDKISTKVPIRPGYTFINWDYSGVKFNPGDAIPSGWGSFTLTAQWRINKYDLKIDPNGGYRASDNNTSIVTVSKEYNSTEHVSERKRTGYTLTGYTMKNSNNGSTTDLGGATFTFDSNSKTGTFKQGTVPITLTAQWTANQYTLTLNPNGGHFSDGNTNAKTLSPNLYYDSSNWWDISSQSTARTGYTLLGWYDSASGGTKVYDVNGHAISGTKYWANNIYKNTSNLTVYAHWQINSYTNTVHHWTWGYKNGEGNNGDKRAFKLGSTTFSKNYNEKYTIGNDKATTIPNGFYLEQSYGTSSIDGNWKDYPFSTQITQKPNSMDFEYEYKPYDYTITYNLNGGTISSSNPSTYNVLYGVTFNNPTRTGHTFTGWYIDGKKVTGINPGANATFSSPSDLYSKLAARTTGNKTVEARWVINKYNLTIDGDSGVESITGSGSYDYGSTVTATYKIKPGYHITNITGTTYDGNNNGVWTGNANKEGTVSDTWSIGACNRTVTVHTAPNTYTIKYDGNGATGGSAASSSHSYDTAKNLTKNGYTNDGYTFKNWNTKADGTGTSYSDQESVKNLTSTNGGTVTLYAQWTPNTYTVSFNGNGATAGTMSSQAYVFDTAKALSANRFSRVYTVSFNTNGGTINSSSTATATAKFNGWEDRNNYVREGVNYSYTSFDAPYYANTYNDLMNAYGYNKYRLLSHYVLYGKNEGRTPKGSSAGLYPNSATVNNLTTTNKGTVTLYANWTLGSVTLPTPSRTGYIFDGWYDANGNKIPGSTYTPTGNTTITAHWTAIKYTVTYNSNKPSTASGNISGTTANSSHTYDTAKNLTANGYSLTGWTFTGWNTKQDGSGTAYKDKESVKNLTSENGKTITLYAQWRPNTYTVVYNGNTATGGNTANSSHVYDVAKSLNKNGYTKENHTFVGWSNGSGTEYKDQQSVKNLTATDKGTVTLYAKWDKAPELTSEKQEYYEGETVTRDMLLSKVKANDREDGDISKKVIITKLAYPAGKLANGKKQAAYEKSWTTGMPETEKLDTWFMQLDKKDAPVTIKMTCKVTDKVGNITEKTFDVLLKYNEFPTIDAEDRAFTWNEANAGLITEDALLKDQIAQGKLSAHDTEDGDVTNKIKILDYNEKDFTSLESSGTVAVTFSVTDKFGKETTRQINIMIVKQDVLSDIEPVKVVRFINEKYYKKNAGIDLKAITEAEEAERNQNGGLNVRSKWYIEDDYRNYINTVWGKTSGDTYTYTKSDLDNIKAYIDANGIGNAEKPNGLSGFVRTYMSDSFKD